MSRKPGRQAAYHDGYVHLCARMCSTCIFRPGSKMHLRPGRVEEMVARSLQDDTAIICHSTLGTEHPAVCRGFYQRHAADVLPLRLAGMLGKFRLVEPPK